MGLKQKERRETCIPYSSKLLELKKQQEGARGAIDIKRGRGSNPETAVAVAVAIPVVVAVAAVAMVPALSAPEIAAARASAAAAGVELRQFPTEAVHRFHREQPESNGYILETVAHVAPSPPPSSPAAALYSPPPLKAPPLLSAAVTSASPTSV